MLLLFDTEGLDMSILFDEVVFDACELLSSKLASEVLEDFCVIMSYGMVFSTNMEVDFFLEFVALS